MRRVCFGLIAHKRKGHTEIDAYLVLQDEKIMLMGDLGFFQSQPFMGYADPEAWKAQLEMFELSDIETFVPGHGSLEKKSDIALMLAYIRLLEDLVGKVIDEGKPVAESLQ